MLWFSWGGSGGRVDVDVCGSGSCAVSEEDVDVANIWVNALVVDVCGSSSSVSEGKVVVDVSGVGLEWLEGDALDWSLGNESVSGCLDWSLVVEEDKVSVSGLGLF